MSVEQIESAILQLPREDFRRLSSWMSKIDQQRWDEQFEKDVADGKLEALAAEALEDYRAGRCRTL